MSKSIDSNKQFMIGNGILAFGVIFIVCLFLYLGFRFQQKPGMQQSNYKDIYSIQVANSFAGDSLAIYINDSLLMSRRFADQVVKFQVGRFAESSVLMVVDTEKDEMTPFNLDPAGSQIHIEKKNSKVFIEEIVNEK